MRRRWLVTLAMFLVSTPAAAQLTVEQAVRRVTTASRVDGTSPAVRLPPTVKLDDDHLVVVAKQRAVRHRLDDRLAWFVPVGARLVVGTVDQARCASDEVFAIDLGSGRRTWRRTLHSSAAAALGAERLAIATGRALEIVDARTGETLSRLALAASRIGYARAIAHGDGYLKAGGRLIAIAPDGTVRWVQPATSRGGVTVTPEAVIDGWVDRAAHRFGIASRDPRDGRLLASIELGSTGGWYDTERLEIAPDGAGELLVTAMFGAA